MLSRWVNISRSRTKLLPQSLKSSGVLSQGHDSVPRRAYGTDDGGPEDGQFFLFQLGPGGKFLLSAADGAEEQQQSLVLDTKKRSKPLTDPSVEVILKKPPEGHIEEDEKEAARLSLNKLYTKRSPLGNGFESAFTVQFNKKQGNQNLDDYVSGKKKRFFLRAPRGEISQVVLPKSTTRRLTQSNTPFQTLLFDAAQLHNRTGQLALFLQTPNGFWDFGLHSRMNLLSTRAQQARFMEAVRSIEVIRKDGLLSNLEAEAAAAASASKQKSNQDNGEQKSIVLDTTATSDSSSH